MQLTHCPTLPANDSSNCPHSRGADEGGHHYDRYLVHTLLLRDSLADSLARFAHSILLLIRLLDLLSARWILSPDSLADSLARFALGSLGSLSDSFA